MRNALVVALVVSGSVGFVGCIGDIIESQPSGMPAGSPDMAQAGGTGGTGGIGGTGGTGGSAGTGGAGGTGGTGGNPSGVTFAQIQQDIDGAFPGGTKTPCSNAGCHGAGAPPALKP